MEACCMIKRSGNGTAEEISEECGIQFNCIP